MRTRVRLAHETTANMNAKPVQKRNLAGHDLKTVLIYDDFNAAAQTKCVLERVARRRGEGLKCSVRPWRLDVLQHGGADDEILADAVGADLVCLVFQSLRALPEWLMGWLERWASRRQVRDAALALRCGGVARLPGSVVWQLGRFAERHGVHLLPTGGQPAEDISTDFVHNLQGRETTMTSTMQFILAQPIRVCCQV
jgi:hypothetical protein